MEHTLLVIVFLLLVVNLTRCSKSHSYKIVEIDERLRFPNNYGWKCNRYPTSDGNQLYGYSVIRVDEVTAKWNLTNARETNDKLWQLFNDTSVRCPIFNPHQFLSMIRNKNLGMFGDSIAKQMFNGVQNSLTPYITEYRNLSNHVVTDLVHEHVVALYFKDYNVTIYYCDDPYVFFDKRDDCTGKFFNNDTDFVVFGVAAHYSPKFINEHRGPSVSYNESYVLSQEILKKGIARARTHISQVLPSAKVIWRLQPHASVYNELRFLYNVSTEHMRPIHWSNSSFAAHWVPVYNEILLKEANKWNDPIMDWHGLSYQYMDYFSRDRGIAVHIDSIHYYADGLPRAGAMLLQDTVYDSLHPHK